MSLNPPKMSLQLKSPNAVSPPDFSRQALSVVPTGLSQNLNAVQISDSGREMAGKLYLGTHQDDPMLPVITPNFRFPAATLSLNPPQDASATKNLNAASLSDFSQKALSLKSTGLCQGLQMLSRFQIPA